jgi:23S rRNA pseudouridine2605 synthase
MATKKSTKSAKPTSLEIIPIEPEPKPKRARKSKAPTPAQTTGIVDPLGEPADGEGKTYLGDDGAPDASKAVAETPATPEIDPVNSETSAHIDAWVAEDSEAAAETIVEATETEELEDEEEEAPKPRPPAKLERLQKILSQAGVASRRKAEEMIEQGRVQVNGTVVTALGTKADAGRDHIRVDGKLIHGAERHRYFVLNKPKGYVTTVKDPEGRPTVMTFFEKMRERLYPVGRLDYLSEGLLLVTNDGELANKLTKAGSGVEKTYFVKVAGQPTEEELDRLRGGVMIERGQPGSERVRTSPARIRQVRQGDNPWYEVVLIEGRNRELRKMFSSIGHFVEKIRRVGYGPLILDIEPGKLRELDPQELEKLKLAAEGKLRTPKAKEVRRRDREDSATFAKPRQAYSRPNPQEPRTERAHRAEYRPDRRENRRQESGRFEPRRSGPGGARPGGPRPSRPFGDRDRGPHPGAGKPYQGSRPQGGSKPFGGSRPFDGDRPARLTFRPAGEGDSRRRPTAGGRFENKPFRGRTGQDKGRWKNAEGERPRSARTGREQSFDRPRREGAGSERSRPQRGTDEFKRPFTPGSGPRRTGGARPTDKPFRPSGQGESRPAFRSGPRPPSGSRPTAGGSPNRRTGGNSRPPSRGFGKPGGRSSGFKNRGGGAGRPGGKKRP